MVAEGVRLAGVEDLEGARRIFEVACGKLPRISGAVARDGRPSRVAQPVAGRRGGRAARARAGRAPIPSPRASWRPRCSSKTIQTKRWTRGTTSVSRSSISSTSPGSNARGTWSSRVPWGFSRRRCSRAPRCRGRAGGSRSCRPRRRRASATVPVKTAAPRSTRSVLERSAASVVAGVARGDRHSRDHRSRAERRSRESQRRRRAVDGCVAMVGTPSARRARVLRRRRRSAACGVSMASGERQTYAQRRIDNRGSAHARRVPCERLDAHWLSMGCRRGVRSLARHGTRRVADVFRTATAGRRSGARRGAGRRVGEATCGAGRWGCVPIGGRRCGTKGPSGLGARASRPPRTTRRSRCGLAPEQARGATCCFARTRCSTAAIIDDGVFGRRLAHGGVEWRRWLQPGAEAASHRSGAVRGRRACIRGSGVVGPPLALRRRSGAAHGATRRRRRADRSRTRSAATGRRRCRWDGTRNPSSLIPNRESQSPICPSNSDHAGSDSVGSDQDQGFGIRDRSGIRDQGLGIRDSIVATPVCENTMRRSA